MDEMKNMVSNQTETPAKKRGRPRKNVPLSNAAEAARKTVNAAEVVGYIETVADFVIIEPNVKKQRKPRTPKTPKNGKIPRVKKTGVALLDPTRDIRKELADSPALDNKKESAGEKETRRILQERLGVVFKSIRPDMLRYDPTGANLELDGYNAEVNMAFEFNGIQHEEAGHFGMTQEDKNKQTDRDMTKYMRLLQCGIRCIILENTPVDKLEFEIGMQLSRIDPELYKKYASYVPKPPAQPPTQPPISEETHHPIRGFFGAVVKKFTSLFTFKTQPEQNISRD